MSLNGLTYFIEKTCCECGEVFVPATYHVYKVRKKNNDVKWFCKWTCFNHYVTRMEESKKKKKSE